MTSIMTHCTIGCMSMCSKYYLLVYTDQTLTTYASEYLDGVYFSNRGLLNVLQFAATKMLTNFENNMVHFARRRHVKYLRAWVHCARRGYYSRTG